MKSLSWDDMAGIDSRGLGFMVNGATRLTLATAPPLAFDFDAIGYDDQAPSAWKSIDGKQSHMTDAEAAAVCAYLDGFASMNGTRLVWGVDSTGALLGLVPRASAFAITPPQPSPASSYRWDFVNQTWTRS